MRIGARGSDLAQRQARMIESRLNLEGIETEMIIISTHGDRVLDVPLNQLGAQGVFTKEIEDALIAGRIDLAVHSFKDVATVQPGGLEIVAITEREDCADLLLIRPEMSFDEDAFIPVKPDSTVGTSAVRRSIQLQALRPDLRLKDLRGNVPTRLDRLHNREYDAIFLAAAGVNRLGLDLSGLNVVRLDPARFVPSPGQGALAIEMRCGDPLVSRIRKCLHHEATATATVIERGLLKLFGGGCSLPLGVWATPNPDGWSVSAFWGDTSMPQWANRTGSNIDEIINELFQNFQVR